MLPSGIALASAVASGLASAQRLHPTSQHLQDLQTQLQPELATERVLTQSSEHAEEAEDESDLVHNLPGLDPAADVTQHAGRIALDGNDKSKIFYWHIQAAKDADKVPLVIWYSALQ